MEKKASYIGVIIFIIIFAIIAVGITVVLANLTKKNNSIGTQNENIFQENNFAEKNEIKNEAITVFLENEKQEEETEVVSSEEHLTLKHLGTETYFNNNLTIKEESYHEGDILDKEYIEWDKLIQYPFYVNYIQIDGLKDKNIQEQINSDIKNKAINLARKAKDEAKDEAKVIYVTTVVEGNFSNILSIFMESEKGEESRDGYRYLETMRL